MSGGGRPGAGRVRPAGTGVQPGGFRRGWLRRFCRDRPFLPGDHHQLRLRRQRSQLYLPAGAPAGGGGVPGLHRDHDRLGAGGARGGLLRAGQPGQGGVAGGPGTDELSAGALCPRPGDGHSAAARLDPVLGVAVQRQAAGRRGKLERKRGGDLYEYQHPPRWLSPHPAK